MTQLILHEGQHTAEFLISEANGRRSRGVGILKNAGATDLTYPAGTVMATLADGSFAPFTGTGPSAAASAILFDNVTVPATIQINATLMQRDAEVNAAELRYDPSNTVATQAAARTQLAAIGIVLR